MGEFNSKTNSESGFADGEPSDIVAQLSKLIAHSPDLQFGAAIKILEEPFFLSQFALSNTLSSHHRHFAKMRKTVECHSKTSDNGNSEKPSTFTKDQPT